MSIFSPELMSDERRIRLIATPLPHEMLVDLDGDVGFVSLKRDVVPLQIVEGDFLRRPELEKGNECVRVRLVMPRVFGGHYFREVIVDFEIQLDAAVLQAQQAVIRSSRGQK